MKKIILLGSYILTGLVMFSPAEAAVCTGANTGGIEDVISWAQCVLSVAVVPLLVTLAMVAFIWGVIQYYLNPGNEEKRKKGKDFIIGGLIALFVIIAMWGLVNILTTTFGFTFGMPRLPA